MKNTKGLKLIGRQGDVFFFATTEEQKECNKSNGKITIALGEHSGHHHTVVPMTAETKIFSQLEGSHPSFDDKDFVEILVKDGDAVVRHEDHGAIILSPGNYIASRQKTYSVVTKQLNRVID